MKASEPQWPTQRRDSISYKKFLPGKNNNNMYKETTLTFHEMSHAVCGELAH